MSRALVHAYLGDRRGLIDAVQVRITMRLDTWVGHGLGRATEPPAALRAMVGGTFSFVESGHDAWGVLVASGGLDHPALHGVRARWVARLAPRSAGPTGSADGADRLADTATVRAQAAVAALLLGVGAWVTRGTDPGEVATALVSLLATGTEAVR